ncbi:lipopolysaccharide biosynthesis protein [Helicobacter pylori]|uniref:glycosyltransferase family 25 protein n=2 Tax=Helicobacter pylori TaxID=210 RepID=UPI000BE7D651|nr:glycosyltransferase family 25 protein [Helicobacter pylori]PDW58535.1 lipopolysaccharide biosynthesis protein [Helicobacter pylori]
MTQVYIISLKESKRRLDTKKLVLESNEKFKGRCVFQIFDAISPKHEDFEKLIQELYDSSSLLKSDWFHSDYCYQELLPQEFGCYLSHYFLWKECVKLNQPVVILEDDVVLESNFMQALEDCLKSPFDFVRLYGHYWGGHKTNLNSLPIYTEAEEAEASIEKTPIENHEVTPPPPNPTQDAQQDCIIETQQEELSNPCKIAPQKISFNPVIFRKIKRKLNRFIGSILARTEVYKNVVAKYDDLTTKYDDLTTKYESLLAKETNIKETFGESRADNEKEALFLEHFYLTSVYVASTAGYYLTPKGAKTFTEATERFKIIEPVDMFMDNSAYHDVANLTYVPCPVSLSEHSLDSTIQKPQKKSLKSYPLPPKKSTFKNLFYYSINAKKRLKAFNKYNKQYAPLKTPKEV